MGHRLSKITTRTGDKGTTGLGDGSRVEKDCPRIEAMGTVDELNSALALLLAEPLPTPVAEALRGVQNDLFDLGGELSTPGREQRLDTTYPERLERLLERFNAELPPLKEFILPGGGRAAACCHLARTICRRAERRVVTLAREAEVPAPVPAYLNRLSDLLFIIGRILARAGDGEVLWQPGKSKVK